MSVKEWQALSWWEQRMYIDGLINEELLVVNEETPTMQEDENVDPVMASDIQLRRLGLQVIDGG